jgi:hypothetical protein
MIALNLPRFDLGRVVATPGAREALERAGQPPGELLDRHVRGDWGDVSPNDKEANNEALLDGSRLLSAYLLTTGVKIWIITEARGEDGRRASTCLLLPEEY